jgi:hypothetical protein
MSFWGATVITNLLSSFPKTFHWYFVESLQTHTQFNRKPQSNFTAAVQNPKISYLMMQRLTFPFSFRTPSISGASLFLGINFSVVYRVMNVVGNGLITHNMAVVLVSRNDFRRLHGQHLLIAGAAGHVGAWAYPSQHARRTSPD